MLAQYNGSVRRGDNVEMLGPCGNQTIKKKWTPKNKFLHAGIRKRSNPSASQRKFHLTEENSHIFDNFSDYLTVETGV